MEKEQLEMCVAREVSGQVLAGISLRRFQLGQPCLGSANSSFLLPQETVWALLQKVHLGLQVPKRAAVEDQALEGDRSVLSQLKVEMSDLA
jgi:hypothetical protein